MTPTRILIDGLGTVTHPMRRDFLSTEYMSDFSLGCNMHLFLVLRIRGDIIFIQFHKMKVNNNNTSSVIDSISFSACARMLLST